MYSTLNRGFAVSEFMGMMFIIVCATVHFKANTLFSSAHYPVTMILRKI